MYVFFCFVLTYPLLLLELPQFHVLDTLLLISLFDKRNLLETFCSLEVVNLERKKN